jgi:hypothetical protein
MPSWDEINNEVSRLMDKAEYKPFRSLLENFQSMVSIRYGSEDIMNGLLEVVKKMQAETQKGAAPIDLARQAAGGYLQPNWNIEGTVNQANRDIFNNIVIQVFGNNLANIEQEQPETAIKVPVLLLVMTRTEADELHSGEGFKEYPEQVYIDEFAQLQAMLQQNQIVDWVQNYGNTPELWKPFSDCQCTISGLVTQTFADIEGFEKSIAPDFIDIRTLNDKTKTERRRLKELREKGCIVIMDMLSMRHPLIQRAYRRTLLDVFANVLIIRLAPTANALRVVQQMIKFSEQYIDLEAYKRFSLDRDPRCSEVSQQVDFERWLVDQTPDLLPGEERAKAGIRQHMYKSGERRGSTHFIPSKVVWDVPWRLPMWRSCCTGAD